MAPARALCVGPERPKTRYFPYSRARLLLRAEIQKRTYIPMSETTARKGREFQDYGRKVARVLCGFLSVSLSAILVSLLLLLLLLVPPFFLSSRSFSPSSEMSLINSLILSAEAEMNSGNPRRGDARPLSLIVNPRLDEGEKFLLETRGNRRETTAQKRRRLASCGIREKE